jgi:hypothetical protein
MKPLFLDCPPVYTRTPRTVADDVRYANAIESAPRETDYPVLWWALIVAVMLAFAFLMGMSYAAP